MPLIKPGFLARFLSAPPPSDDLPPGPLRGELLGADRLAERARDLARAQTLARADQTHGHPALLARLKATRKILKDSHTRLAATAGSGEDIGPIAWLAVYGFADGANELMWINRIDPAVTVPNGDVLRIPNKVRFWLEGI